MTLQEINQAIAIQLKGWTYVEGTVYQDAVGQYQYLAPWSESPPHALDLAYEYNISLDPVTGTGQWTASASAENTVTSSSICVAICECALATLV